MRTILLVPLIAGCSAPPDPDVYSYGAVLKYVTCVNDQTAAAGGREKVCLGQAEKFSDSCERELRVAALMKVQKDAAVAGTGGVTISADYRREKKLLREFITCGASAETGNVNHRCHVSLVD